MQFDDLSQKSYVGDCPHIRSVGWLGAGHDFSMGDAPTDLIPLLQSHLNDHWFIFAAAGLHDCELCAEQGVSHSDSRNLFIPSTDVVYFAPGMIIHYIEAHSYCPPQPFIDAFLELMKDFGVWWDAQMEFEAPD